MTTQFRPRPDCRARATLSAMSAALCCLHAAAAPAARSVAAAAAEPAHTIVTARGDTLIGLGKRWLADPAAWPEVARANALRNPNRIATGSELRIPLRLMRLESAPATLVSVTGAAQGGAAGAAPSALRAGQTLPEGGAVATGPDGSVTIRLVDGTLLRLRSDSRLQLRVSRRVPGADVVRSGSRLDKGRVEIEAAPARAGRPGFTIDTPQGVLGVRGTEFRVAIDEAQGLTRGEVLGGTVAFDAATAAANAPGVGASAANSRTQRVTAGYGSVVDASGAVAAPVRLLPAPDVSGLPALQERLLMRFALAPLPGAAAYRGQIARDAAFDTVVADLTTPGPELRFAELPDGDYALRVRGIDGLGLEGRDTDHRFRLKARPEAPLPAAPAPRKVSYGSQVDFAWAANAQAASYRLQLAATPDFKAPLRDIANLRELATQVDGLQPGIYHWRLASVRGEGAASDQGPWGDSRSFELRPPPPVPKAPQVGDNAVNFSWEGSPGQTFEFQLARDAAFTQLVVERTLQQPAIELPLPGTGRFYVRLRARDPDGYLGPWTTPQYFDVPNCLRDSSGGCVRAAEQTLNLAP